MPPELVSIVTSFSDERTVERDGLDGANTDVWDSHGHVSNLQRRTVLFCKFSYTGPPASLRLASDYGSAVVRNPLHFLGTDDPTARNPLST